MESIKWLNLSNTKPRYTLNLSVKQTYRPRFGRSELTIIQEGGRLHLCDYETHASGIMFPSYAVEGKVPEQRLEDKR